MGILRQKNTRDKYNRNQQLRQITSPNRKEKRPIVVERLNRDLEENVSKKIVNQKYKKRRKKPRPDILQSEEYTILSKPIATSKYSLLPTPSWFTNRKKVDVSIIVPMFKSKKVITEQIRKWVLTNDGLSKEIIYVDDACPEKSYEVIVNEWTQRKKDLETPHNKNETSPPIGKIVSIEYNSGYGQACNAGANFAQGDYLIFLNADCTVTHNWVKPMYDVISSNKKAGIVGNLQLRYDNTIDSAGSVWDWNQNHFPHIGRNVYNGKRVSNPFKFDKCPTDLKVVGKREMVTGCCFMISNQLFTDLEGFDANYKIGYWEDSDLNMKVREDNYEIYYTPHSIVYHGLGHSKAHNHPFKSHNAKFFRGRWIHTGRLDKLVSAIRPGGTKKVNIKNNIDGKVVGCVIACNEEEFLEASVESIAPVVDRFVFVIGGNEYAYKSDMCDRRGYPTDNTLNIAKKLAIKYGGIVIEPPNRLWRDKVEMRNAYTQHIKPGEWMFMLDGDEVYKPRQLWRLTEIMKDNDVLILQFWLFWNNVNTIGTGSWQKYPQERLVKWKEGFNYRGNNHLHVLDVDGVPVKTRYKTWTGNEKLFLSLFMGETIKENISKRKYYEFQSGFKDDQYVNDVFVKWRNNPEMVKSTHPRGGGGTAPFSGIHPIQVEKLIKEGKLNW